MELLLMLLSACPLLVKGSPTTVHVTSALTLPMLLCTTVTKTSMIVLLPIHVVPLPTTTASQSQPHAQRPPMEVAAQQTNVVTLVNAIPDSSVSMMTLAKIF